MIIKKTEYETLLRYNAEFEAENLKLKKELKHAELELNFIKTIYKHFINKNELTYVDGDEIIRLSNLSLEEMTKYLTRPGIQIWFKLPIDRVFKGWSRYILIYKDGYFTTGCRELVNHPHGCVVTSQLEDGEKDEI